MSPIPKVVILSALAACGVCFGAATDGELSAGLSFLKNQSLEDQTRGIKRLNSLDGETLRKHGSAILPVVKAYVEAMGEQSGEALVLFGKTAAVTPQNVAWVQMVMKQAKGRESSSGGERVISERIQKGGRIALCLLGDKTVIGDVAAGIAGGKKEDRIEAIQIALLSPAEFKDGFKKLLASKEDAFDISPSQNGDYVIRYCDVAVKPLVEAYSLKPNFDASSLRRFSDSEIAEVAKAIP